MEGNFNWNGSDSKTCPSLEGKNICWLSVVFSNSLEGVLCVGWFLSDIPGHTGKRPFCSYWRMLLNCLLFFWKILFCFTLLSGSPLASFCSRYTIAYEAFSLCSSRALFSAVKYANTVLACSTVHCSQAVFDSFSTVGIPWGTLAQGVLLVEWFWPLHTRTQMHVCSHSGRRNLAPTLKLTDSPRPRISLSLSFSSYV